MKLAFCLAAALVTPWFLPRAVAAAPPLVAHEWGTFTALQNEQGEALGAINADDEPVPGFVNHSYFGGINISAANQVKAPLAGSKWFPRCSPDVTMRLETPVIYFYPPAGAEAKPLDVHVGFRGGFLTEFYPNAQASAANAPGPETAATTFPRLNATTEGVLDWKGLELNAPGTPIATDDPVWTTPRHVPAAALVRTTLPDDLNLPEKFLFYRGVGHLDSPLRVVADSKRGTLNILGDAGHPMDVPEAWLVEIRAGDGACAFRRAALGTLPATFASAEFSGTRLAELRTEMSGALVAQGLFPDEAAAMLDTWQLSYFKSPGRRLFYLVPRPWVDAVLPLTIPGAEVTRVMIGRIELVTPEQRTLIARIAAGPCPDFAKFSADYWGRDGEPVANPGVQYPPLFRDFVQLGRFREALLLDEQRRRPTAALAAFITGSQIGIVASAN